MDTFTIEGLDWITFDWTKDKDGRRLKMRIDGIVMMPYVRQTYRSRFRRDAFGKRCREYNDQQALIRDALILKMKQVGELSYEKEKLGFSAQFGMSNKTKLQVSDLDNLTKALKDCLVGCILKDDRYIYKDRDLEKMPSDSDFMLVEIWELKE